MAGRTGCLYARTEAFNMYSHHLKWQATRELSWSGFYHDFGRVIGLSIALVALLVQLGHASEWSAVDNTTDGIQVYRKEVDSGLVSLRGVGVVEAPLALVATVIFDTARRREWIDGLADSRIIRWQDKDNFVEYDHIELPFFLKDRDFVSKISMSYDQSRKEMVFHYQPSDEPSAPQTNYVRGELINAVFILSSIDDRKTLVDAEFLCDPKGWIPKWLVNFFLSDWPKTTFRNLRKEVLKDLSIDKRFSRLPEQKRSRK